VVQLHRKIDLIRNAGADLVVIGNGSPSFIAGFRDETGWDGPLYTDPSLAVFKAAELKRGVAKTLNPLALGKTIRAFAQGHRQGKTQGDPWQQGGVLVIAPGNEVRWHHASERPGDNATAEDIAAALRSAA
jgi:hypothetical protein